MKFTRLIGFVAALGLAALAVPAQARVGGISHGTLLFAGGTDFINSNTSTASDYAPSTIFRNTFAAGQVITIEAWGNVSTTGGPTLNVGVVVGNTQMIASGVQTMGTTITNNPFYVRAVGHIRTAGASGLVQWELYVFYDQATDIVRQFNDPSPDAIDTTINGQDIGLRFTWNTADTANTMTISQMVIRIE